MKYKVLMLDDDIEVLQVNKKYLSEKGFGTAITNQPAKALALAKSYQPDCILLDIMMPQSDGFTVLQALRKFYPGPIIFLTGKGAIDDRVRGLSSGCDDYIVKPCELAELRARIELVIKRYRGLSGSGNTDDLVLTFGDLKIDQVTHKAFCDDDDLLLSNREYELLLYFARNPDRDITFAEIGTALLGLYQPSDQNSIMVLVSRLRKKLAARPRLRDMIATVWSKGYRFVVNH